MHLKIFLLALLLLSFNSSADSGSRQKALAASTVQLSIKIEIFIETLSLPWIFLPLNPV